MVFLFFSIAFLFFKTYGFPFSGSLILGLTLALSQFHSAKSLRPGAMFLLFPASICFLSLWDGSSPEEILDLLCVSLAGIISGGGFSFLSARSPAFREIVGILLLGSSCVLSYSRRDLSPFLVPCMAVLLTTSLSKKSRSLFLSFAILVGIAFLFLNPNDHESEISFFKLLVLSVGIGFVLIWKGRTDFIGGFLYFTFFLLVCLSGPGKEFTLFTLSLFFSYLQEGGRVLESGGEIGDSSNHSL